MADSCSFRAQEVSLLSSPSKSEWSTVDHDCERKQRSSLNGHILSWLAQTVVFTASLATLYRSGHVSGSQHQRCLEKHAVWSPAIDVVSDTYKATRFNGTFDNHSPYKSPPSPEVDAEWDKLIDVGVLNVNDETMDRIGHSKDSVRLPQESGGGFMGSLGFSHQLHCVYLLWQATHPDYYLKKGGPTWVDSPPTRRKHIDHCADLLRQKLMCDADVGVFTYNWVRGRSRPYPNFNTVHQCRNFDDILAWAKSHQAKAPTGGVITKPPDAVELSVPP